MGKRVHYCGEQFENDGSIGLNLLKTVKRVMAGAPMRGPKVKLPSDRKQTCGKDDLAEVLPTDRRFQVALSVGDMPEVLGRLFDRGIEDHFRDH